MTLNLHLVTKDYLISMEYLLLHSLVPHSSESTIETHLTEICVILMCYRQKGNEVNVSVHSRFASLTA